MCISQGSGPALPLAGQKPQKELSPACAGSPTQQLTRPAWPTPEVSLSCCVVHCLLQEISPTTWHSKRLITSCKWLALQSWEVQSPGGNAHAGHSSRIVSLILSEYDTTLITEVDKHPDQNRACHLSHLVPHEVQALTGICVASKTKLSN